MILNNTGEMTGTDGKGEYFRDTILDALLFEGETILEC